MKSGAQSQRPGRAGARAGDELQIGQPPGKPDPKNQPSPLPEQQEYECAQEMNPKSNTDDSAPRVHHMSCRPTWNSCLHPSRLNPVVQMSQLSLRGRLSPDMLVVHGKMVTASLFFCHLINLMGMCLTAPSSFFTFYF